MLDEQSMEVVRRCQRYVTLEADFDLAAIPFDSAAKLVKFFTCQKRTKKLADFVFSNIPYDVHFPLQLVHATLSEPYRMSVYLDGKKTSK